MGLADEKLKRHVQEEADKKEKSLGDQGLPMKFVVDWNSFGAAFGKETTDRAGWTVGHLAGKFYNFMINADHPDIKPLVDAIKSSFSTVKIAHAGTGKEYAYTLDIKDKVCTFTADMTKFTWSSSSKDDQPGLQEYFERIL